MRALILFILPVVCLLFNPVLSSIDGSQEAVELWPARPSGPSRDVRGWTNGPVGYSGPQALPQILSDGSLADVPEVASARAAHLAAVQAAYTDPRATDGDDGLYDVYKYGDNHYPYHEDHGINTVGRGRDWQVEYRPTVNSFKPIPNPHAREAEAKAWRN